MVLSLSHKEKYSYCSNESARGKSVLMGLDTDVHSPNEHFGLAKFYKGIETIPLFIKTMLPCQNKLIQDLKE